MKAMQQFNNFLIIKGIKLEPHESIRLALKKEDALKAIDLLTKADIPILGGDVYLIQQDKVHPTIALWYYNREKNEKWDDYVNRTLEKSRQFINAYPETEDTEPLFILEPETNEAEYLYNKQGDN